MPGGPGRTAAILLLSLAACASGPPLQPEGHRLAPLVTATADQAGVRDLRGDFRAALCERLANDPAHPCGSVLTRMGAEPPPSGGAGPTIAQQASRFRIGIVPGFFAECLEDEARPFQAAAKELRAQGFEVIYLPVTGRGSVATNSDMLAKEIAALPADPRPLILVGYSKGMPDALDLVVRYPVIRRQVAALVGVGGASYGSPLADRYEDLWRATFMSSPIGNCKKGQGEGVHDLRRDVRVAWWVDHGRAVDVPLYSIVGLPEKERVSPVMASTHNMLSDIDPRNDGQVIWTDAVAVPGALLGYVNADHWALAMRLSQAFPLLASSFIDDVPRGAMLGAAIDVVARDLENQARAPRAP
jgi:hypothetical protein